MNNFKEKMHEKIKLFSDDSYLDGYIKNEFLTDDEDADIFLKLNNYDELFDSRTTGDQKDLNDSIYEFIEKKSAMLDSSVKIELHILGLDLSKHEQGIAKHILKEHYAIELYKIQKQYTKYRDRVIKLLLFGLVCLFIYSFFFFFTDFDYFLTIFSFLFTFSLWEAFSLIIGKLNSIKKQREDITQNLLMGVSFSEINKE